MTHFTPGYLAPPPASITKTMLANGAVARVVIPFPLHSGGVAVAATDYFVTLGGWGGDALMGTTEANAQLTLTGYTMVVREFHFIAGTGTVQAIFLRDDGADVTGAGTSSTTTAGTEFAATGLSVTVAAGSKVNLRVKGNGATVRGGGFIVADVYP